VRLLQDNCSKAPSGSSERYATFRSIEGFS
jgi:hypothetical protein